MGGVKSLFIHLNGNAIMLDRILDVPEMHDRLIAAESIAYGTSVVTRDEMLAASDKIDTVW